MALIYKTRDGDMLDDICWRHYQREGAMVEVLKANPDLADVGAILPSGLEIILPNLSEPEIKESFNLWD